MKICVLGGGTSGAVTICSFIKALLDRGISLDNYEFTCIHDPKIDTLQVGESLSPGILNTLTQITGYKYDPDNLFFNESLRKGTKLHWEKVNGRQSFVTYNKEHPGIHVDSSLFSSVVLSTLERLYSCVNIIQDNISSINQDDNNVTLLGNETVYAFDYLVDCTGFPSKEELEGDDYNKPVHEFVNSAVIFPDFKEYNEDFTSAYAHDNGWMFGVPLQHRKAFGYCYNNQYTSYDEAVKDFEKLINIDRHKLRHITWTQYYKKKASNNRIFYNGNKLYFFEPHQGLPLHYFSIIADYIINTLNEVGVNKSIKDANYVINNYHLKTMEHFETLIALNYAGDNNIKSKYWNYSVPIAKSILKNSTSLLNWHTINNEARFTNRDAPQVYGNFNDDLMIQYLNSFSINLNIVYNSN